MISSGRPSNCKKMITDRMRESDVLGYYLGISEIPCLIVSPFRNDTKPSLNFYIPNNGNGLINYIDFGSGERGSMISFFMKLWNLDYNDTVDKIVREVVVGTHINEKGNRVNHKVTVHTGGVELKCKAREWRDYDIEYWSTYGISIEWLKWAEVYPISHKFIVKDDNEMVFRADKYAYVFVERKEGRITMKFYQPFNTSGYKWQNSHDKSVLGLWSKLPETGKAVCICSSVKDALCLMSNLYIPCICLQGEGYPMSNTAVKELKRRFTDVYLCLDNDDAGRIDSIKLSEEHNFINVIIPQFKEGKDISDYMKAYGRESFKTFFKKLFADAREAWYNELPFKKTKKKHGTKRNSYSRFFSQ